MGGGAEHDTELLLLVEIIGLLMLVGGFVLGCFFLLFLLVLFAFQDQPSPLFNVEGSPFSFLIILSSVFFHSFCPV